ncbi:hypothetical protein FSHL1_002715 [Fusarium sambucinum]
MDAFQTLPSEICLLIIGNIYSHTTLWRLLKASPKMLRCHQQNKAWILRTYISRLIQAGGNDEGLLEDAMAIIGFNRAQGDDWIINCHFNQWASNNLPDPFKSFDEYRITELDRIFARLGLFIEDYMSKATSSNPVLRYLSLPSIVYTDTDTDNRVTLDDLTPTERYRLFRAFLRYEMLCKVFDPKVKDAVGADYQWIGGSYHQTWYGNNEQSPGLERYWRIAHDSWETLDPWLYESLHCVWDYIQACYGAVLAHVAWADKYPAFLTEGLRKKNLLFPDNMYVNSYTYFGDLRLSSRCHYLTYWAPGKGTDLLFHLLTHMGKGPQGT